MFSLINVNCIIQIKLNGLNVNYYVFYFYFSYSKLAVIAFYFSFNIQLMTNLSLFLDVKMHFSVCRLMCAYLGFCSINELQQRPKKNLITLSTIDVF